MPKKLVRILLTTIIISLGLLKRTFFSVFHILIYSKYFPNIKQVKNNQNKICYILGNGPSLKDVLSENLDLLKNNDLFVVNDMAISDFYEELEPKFYVLADPCYFSKNVYEQFVSEAENVLQMINTKTRWPMHLLVPYVGYRNKWFRDYFKNNEHVNIVYYNLNTFSGYNSIKNFAYKNYLAMPRAQNVIIPCIYFAINLGYSEINLFGVEHSWTKDIIVNEKNEVCKVDKHFYNKQSNQMIPFRRVDGEIYKMHQILNDFAFMFEGYHETKRYADYRNANVYNCTEGSFIDAFPRKNISDCVKTN